MSRTKSARANLTARKQTHAASAPVKPIAAADLRGVRHERPLTAACPLICSLFSAEGCLSALGPRAALPLTTSFRRLFRLAGGAGWRAVFLFMNAHAFTLLADVDTHVRVMAVAL
jgi:hypothetical protein